MKRQLLGGRTSSSTLGLGMALKKTDMEADGEAYRTILSKVKQAEREGAYKAAIELALSSLPHIAGMLQYVRKYEKRELASVETLDVVFKCAPVILDRQSLDQIDALLCGDRRIERNTLDSLADKLASARSRLRNAHMLWSHLESARQFRQDELRRSLGGNQEQWRSFVEEWERLGLVNRLQRAGSYLIHIVTQMDAVLRAKCPGCGAIVRAEKLSLLQELCCLQCRAAKLLVILSDEGEA